MLENRPVEFFGSSGAHLSVMSFCLSPKIPEYINGIFQTSNLESGGIGKGGWRGVGEGLGRGWGKVGEGLAFYSSKTPFEKNHECSLEK